MDVENGVVVAEATSGSIKDTINAIRSNGKVYKVIVLGDSSVGKTTLTYRFCEGRFLEKVQSTIGVDFRSKTVQIDGQNVVLQLWDTAGQKRHRTSMIPHYYRNAHAVVFVYDVTNARSFDNLLKWIKECEKHCLHHALIPRILIGNKCDCVATVTTNVAQRFADQHNMPLFETSARLESQCDNVEGIFMTLAHKLVLSKPFLPPTNCITIQRDEPPNQQSNWNCVII